MNAEQTTSGVAVLGLGYVGCVSAACLAHLGHHVIGVDRDAHKVAAVNRGEAPFYEPGLNELVKEGLSSGRLSAVSDLGEALSRADLALICVGTPSDANGNLDLSHVQRVCEEIARCHVPGQALTLAIRSTVFPGTCEELVRPTVGSDVQVVSHPEFLREGTAVRDFMEPSLIVIGGSDKAAVERVAALYASLNAEISRVSLRTAEMIKYACNSFHALKIAFANEVGTLGQKLGVDPSEVMATLCQDTKLNVSAAYLKPGFAFGGSCLPKDLRALVYRSSRMGLEFPLLKSILPSNQEHLQRSIRSALEFKGNIGIYGLAFKENTDDIRESPVVILIEQLLGKGRDLRIFDPHIRMEDIYGSNLNFVTKLLPHVGRLMVKSAEDLLSWADSIVIAQKPPAEFREKVQAANLPVLDLTILATKQDKAVLNDVLSLEILNRL